MRKQTDEFEDFEEDISPEELQEEQLPEQQEDFYQDDFNDDFSDMGGGVVPMDRHGDLLKELTDFDPYLKKKMYEWMGFSFNIRSGKFEKDKDIEPLLNYKGARRMISFLGTFARGNNIITTLDQRGYNELMTYVIETMAFSVGPYKEEYGMITNADFLYFWNDLQCAVILVLSGAGGGKYSELLSTTTQRNESISQQMQQGQGGYGGGMYPQQQGKKGFLSTMKNMITGGTR